MAGLIHSKLAGDAHLNFVTKPQSSRQNYIAKLSYPALDVNISVHS